MGTSRDTHAPPRALLPPRRIIRDAVNERAVGILLDLDTFLAFQAIVESIFFSGFCTHGGTHMYIPAGLNVVASLVD